MPPQNPFTNPNRIYTEDFFVYLLPIGTQPTNNLTTGATAINNIAIQADSDFEWKETTCYGNLHGTAEPISSLSFLPVLIQIQDSGTSRTLFSGPTPINMIAGNGSLPFILPTPRIFASKSNIQVTATSFGAGTFDNLFLAFIGRKIFDVTPR